MGALRRGHLNPPALLQSVWLFLVAGAVALTVLAAREDRLPGDLDIAQSVQGWPFPGDTLAEIIRAITTTEVVLVAGFALAAGLWIAGARREAVALAVGLAVLPFAQAGLKDLVDRPRPSADLVELRAGYSSPSFPAGHVMSPTLLYGFVLYLCVRLPLPKPLAWLAGCLSAAILLLTGLANVYLGVHWPSDALGGYLWGLVLLLPLLWRTSARKAV